MEETTLGDEDECPICMEKLKVEDCRASVSIIIVQAAPLIENVQAAMRARYL